LTQFGFISHIATVKPQIKKRLHVRSILRIHGQCNHT
jgi:hypothetical protein